MKIFILNLVIIIIVLAGEVSGQVIPSSCEAPDSVKALYQDDADQFALKRILGLHLAFEDSILIPATYVDSFLWPLLAVYNATSLPERDTVVTIFDIHDQPVYALNKFNIAADSTLPWMETLQQGMQPSGNHQLDSILDRYGFQLDDYESWSGWFFWHSVTFKSVTNYNVNALKDLIEQVPEVAFADLVPYIYIEDGDHIYFQKEEFPFSSTLVTYLKRWSVTQSRWWVFRVYDNCWVEFVGAYGSHPPFTATHEIAKQKISIQPNPVDDFFEIESLQGSFNYSIADISGRIVKTGYQEDNRIENLSQLLPGIYFLSVRQGNKSFTLKMLKG